MLIGKSGTSPTALQHRPWHGAWSLGRSIEVAAVGVACVAFAPMLFVAHVAIEAGWTTFARLVFRERVAALLFNTASLILLTVPICAVIAVGLAWLVVRSTMPGRQVLGWLAIAPLAIPAFVHSYAWSGLFPGLGGIGGGVLVSTLAYFPFLYLPVLSALDRLDPALEDVAASMGLGPWQVFRRVVLPQLRIALCGGALLVSTHLLAEYALFVMMRFDTLTTAIVEQFQSGVGGTAAIMLALVLIAACVTLFSFEFLIRGDRRYARVGSGAARRHALAQLGSMGAPCMVLSFLWVGLALLVPLLTLGRWLWLGGSKVWVNPEVGFALIETLYLAAAAALLATVAAFPAAWVSVRRGGPLARFSEAASYFASSIPGVITALALVFITVHLMRSFYQTLPTLLIAYAIMFLARAIVGLRASLAQVPRSLEDVAGSLGRSPLRTLIEVTLRLAAPGVASAMALVALGVATELTATLLLAPNGTRTLASQFWAYSSEIDYVAASPYAVLMIVLSLPMTLILRRQSLRVIDA